MTAPSMSVELFENLTESLSVRGRRRVFKAANGAAGVHWRDKYLMRHFQSGAATRYGYARRKRSTIARKKRDADRGQALHGGRRPLVHSGRLAAAMRRLHPVRATPSKATITLHGPRQLNIRPKAGRPNLGMEVLRVSGGEVREINQVSADAADAEMAKSKPRKRVVK